MKKLLPIEKRGKKQQKSLLNNDGLLALQLEKNYKFIFGRMLNCY